MGWQSRGGELAAVSAWPTSTPGQAGSACSSEKLARVEIVLIEVDNTQLQEGRASPQPQKK